MKRIVCLCLAVVSIVPLTGCYPTGYYDNATVVELNSDGSGQIVISEVMPTYVIEETAAKGHPWRFREEAMHEQARSCMFNYEGVSLGPVTAIEKPDGSRGHRTVYRFKDISKVKMPFSMMPRTRVEFSYTNSQLSVVMPKVKGRAIRLNPKDSEASRRRAALQDPKEGRRYKSYKCRLMLKAPAEIRETNASYRGTPTNPADGSSVTLIDIDLEKMLNDTRGRAKFCSYQLDTQNYIPTAKLLNGTPGVKYETNAVVTIPVVLAPTAATLAKQKLDEESKKGAEKAFREYFAAIRAVDYQAYSSLLSKDLVTAHPEILDKKEFEEGFEDFEAEFVSMKVDKIVVKGVFAIVTASYRTKLYGTYEDDYIFKLIDGKWYLYDRANDGEGAALVNEQLALETTTSASSKEGSAKAAEAEKAFLSFFNALKTGDFKTFLSFYPDNLIEKDPGLGDKKAFLNQSEEFRETIDSFRVDGVDMNGDVATITATFRGNRGGDTRSLQLRHTQGKWFFHVEDEEGSDGARSARKRQGKEPVPRYTKHLDEKVHIGTDADLAKIKEKGQRTDAEITDIIEKSILWKAKIHAATWEPMELASVLKDKTRFKPEGNFYKVQKKTTAFGGEVVFVGLIGLDWARGPNVILRSTPKKVSEFITKKYKVKLEYKAEAKAYMADLGKDLRLVIIKYPGNEKATLVIGEYTGQ